jgi:hypothetical protein
MTTVAFIPGVGIIQKHAREMVSPKLTRGRHTMAVAKLLSYVRPRRTDGPSSGHLSICSDEVPGARSIIRSNPVKSWSMFSTSAHLIGVIGESLLAIAAWLVSEMLAGCATYVLAVHGIPRTMLDEDAAPSPAPSLPTGPHRPTLHLVSQNIRIGDPVVPTDALPCAVPNARLDQRMRRARIRIGAISVSARSEVEFDLM